jgi:signal transduction histidine kinase
LNIFTRFYQSKDGKKQRMNPYGNGIGLSISKSIAEALNGELTVKSELDVGSTFTFRFVTEVCDKTCTDNSWS